MYDIVQALKAEPEVRFAEPNLVYSFLEAPYFPNDPMWAYTDDPLDPLDSAYDQWGPAMAGANIVWNETAGSEDTIVAVMDTGVRFDHEDLNDNIWINEGEIANTRKNPCGLLHHRVCEDLGRKTDACAEAKAAIKRYRANEHKRACKADLLLWEVRHLLREFTPPQRRSTGKR